MFTPTLTSFAGSSPPWSLQALDNNFSNVSSGLLSANTFSNYLVDTGAVNAYVVSTSPGTATLSAGLQVQIKIANTNTGASTLNVSATGVKSIKNQDGSALVAGQLVAGAVYTLIYDGTNYQLTLSNTSPLFSKGTQGPVATFSNSAGANFNEFTVQGATVRIAIGALSGEANVAFNMNYATGVHRFYDNTLPATWLAMNIAGTFFQFAPASGMAGDIWTGQGSLVNFIVDNSGNSIIRGKHVVQRETMTLVNGANQNVPLPSTGCAFAQGPTGAFSIGGIVAPAAHQSVGTAYGDGHEILILFNNTAFNMTINHADAGSTAANRIFCRNNANLALVGVNSCAILMYVPIFSGWVVVGNN